MVRNMRPSLAKWATVAGMTAFASHPLSPASLRNASDCEHVGTVSTRNHYRIEGGLRGDETDVALTCGTTPTGYDIEGQIGRAHV